MLCVGLIDKTFIANKVNILRSVKIEDFARNKIFLLIFLTW